ncbi:MAG: hypothetical protein ACK52S_13035, partial [Pirellula sp.]
MNRAVADSSSFQAGGFLSRHSAGFAYLCLKRSDFVLASMVTMWAPQVGVVPDLESVGLVGVMGLVINKLSVVTTKRQLRTKMQHRPNRSWM